MHLSWGLCPACGVSLVAWLGEASTYFPSRVRKTDGTQLLLGCVDASQQTCKAVWKRRCALPCTHPDSLCPYVLLRNKRTGCPAHISTPPRLTALICSVTVSRRCCCIHPPLQLCSYTQAHGFQQRPANLKTAQHSITSQLSAVQPRMGCRGRLLIIKHTTCVDRSYGRESCRGTPTGHVICVCSATHLLLGGPSAR
jgi:hypothetical protein